MTENDPLHDRWWVIHDHYKGTHVGTINYIKNNTQGFVHNFFQEAKHGFMVRRFNYLLKDVPGYML